MLQVFGPYIPLIFSLWSPWWSLPAANPSHRTPCHDMMGVWIPIDDWWPTDHPCYFGHTYSLLAVEHCHKTVIVSQKRTGIVLWTKLKHKQYSVLHANAFTANIAIRLFWEFHSVSSLMFLEEHQLMCLFSQKVRLLGQTHFKVYLFPVSLESPAQAYPSFPPVAM